MYMSSPSILYPPSHAERLLTIRPASMSAANSEMSMRCSACGGTPGVVCFPPEKKLVPRSAGPGDARSGSPGVPYCATVNPLAVFHPGALGPYSAFPLRTRLVPSETAINCRDSSDSNCERFIDCSLLPLEATTSRKRGRRLNRPEQVRATSRVRFPPPRRFEYNDPDDDRELPAPRGGGRTDDAQGPRGHRRRLRRDRGVQGGGRRQQARSARRRRHRVHDARGAEVRHAADVPGALW